MPTADRSLRIVRPQGPASGSRPADKYQVIFEHSSDAIITVHPDGRIDTVNRAAEELFGWMRGELVDQKVALFVPDAVIHRVPRYAKRFSVELLQESGTYEDVAIARKDGFPRMVDMSVRTIAEGGVLLSVVLFRDFTEKRQMERERITKHAELRESYVELERKNAELQSMQAALVQAGKMAALGELTAGIAHEINHPLQAIRGFAQELEGIIPASARTVQVDDYLGEIIKNADTMRKIIDSLRAYTRRTIENVENVDVNAVVEDALSLMARQLESRGIEFTREFSPERPSVLANAVQLEQVIINLVSNSREAIAETGRGRGRISIRTRSAGKLVEIRVSDDGIGMNEGTRAKIFNPFFTTRDAGKGMGLGLSISYGIIGLLHGSIVVESEFGKGTEFTIRIPRDFREAG